MSYVKIADYVPVRENGYTPRAMARALTMAFHAKGQMIGRYCRYDKKTLLFKWIPRHSELKIKWKTGPGEIQVMLPVVHNKSKQEKGK